MVVHRVYSVYDVIQCISRLVRQGIDRAGAPSVGLFISTSKERLCAVS